MPALLLRTSLPKPDDPELIRIFCDAIREGHPIPTAATYAGIHERTAYDWIQLGGQEAGESYGGEPSPRARFAQAYKRAQADFVAENLGFVRASRDKDKGWLPAMTLLERRRPQDFGRRTEVHVQSESVRINLYGVLPPEAQLALARRQAELAQLRLQEGKRD